MAPAERTWATSSASSTSTCPPPGTRCSPTPSRSASRSRRCGRGARKWDHLMVGAVEIGLVLNGLLWSRACCWRSRPGASGGPGGRAAGVLVPALPAFAGVLALRAFVDDPARRGAWTAVATIVAYVDVPLVYFCVRWWNSLHQMQSTPGDDVGRVQAADAHQRLRHPVPGLLVHRAPRRARAAAPGDRRGARAGTNPGGRAPRET